MSQFLGFGDGSDGDLVISSPTTFAPIDSSCSGTAGTKSLAATNASFTAGQFILIWQTRGTGAGAWEINRIASYVAGTITTVYNLDNTYTDSGDSQAQVLVLKQYSSVNIAATLTAKAWDGDVGGMVAWMCSGRTYGAANITGVQKGFRGGTGVANGRSYTGEGSIGASVQKSSADESANGSGGGGGGQSGGGGAWDAGGGGGGNGGSGENGTGNGGGAQDPGTGGGSVGSATLTSIFMGGGGGGRSNETGSNTRDGLAGGACVMIFSRFFYQLTITVSAASPTSNGGAGAAGSIFIKSKTADIGTNLLTAASSTKTDLSGGGGVGRIRIEACDISGSSASPVDSESEGGFDFCASGAGQIF